MRRLLVLLPIVALGAGCEDFLDPEFNDGEGAFDDLGHLGEEGAHDAPGLDPVDVGAPFEPFASQSLQIATIGEPSVWEDLDPELATGIRDAGDGLVAIRLLGEEVLGTSWVEGDRLVVYALTTWDFANDAVEGPVEAELVGTAARPAP